MQVDPLGAQVGTAKVTITQGRGLNADELADMAMAKLVFVGPDVAPGIREQAGRVRSLLLHYLAQAQASQNTTIFNRLLEAGETRAAELVRSF